MSKEHMSSYILEELAKKGSTKPHASREQRGGCTMSVLCNAAYHSMGCPALRATTNNKEDSNW